MEENIKNWLILITKNQITPFPHKINNQDVFLKHFWKCFISIVNDPRLFSLIKEGDTFFNNVFDNIPVKLSLFDELHDKKIIEILLEEKNFQKYTLVYYMLKKEENLYFNNFQYAFNTLPEEYKNLPEVVMKLTNDFINDSIIYETSEVINKTKFSYIEGDLYIKLLSVFLEKIESEKLPAFFSQLNSSFLILDYVFDNEEYHVFKEKVKNKLLPYPFIGKEKEEYFMMGDFEYFLYNINKMFSKIILNENIKEIFYASTNNMIHKIDKDKMLPTSKKLLEKIKEKMETEIVRNKSISKSYNINKMREQKKDNILKTQLFFEKINMIYTVIFLDIKNEQEPNKTVRRRRM